MSAETIRLVGGTPALDFANSVDWTADETPLPATDALPTPTALATWSARVGLAPPPPPAATTPRTAAAELARALALREALHRVFSALAGAREPRAEDLETLRADYAEAAAAGALVASEDAVRLSWPPTAPARFAVAADAVALLADPVRLARLRRCPGRDCGWLFLDATGRRRWCAMEACGSREKMRRLYARRRGT